MADPSCSEGLGVCAEVRLCVREVREEESGARRESRESLGVGTGEGTENE